MAQRDRRLPPAARTMESLIVDLPPLRAVFGLGAQTSAAERPANTDAIAELAWDRARRPGVSRAYGERPLDLSLHFRRKVQNLVYNIPG